MLSLISIELQPPYLRPRFWTANVRYMCAPRRHFKVTFQSRDIKVYDLVGLSRFDFVGYLIWNLIEQLIACC
jgi:hypothetical protein